MASKGKVGLLGQGCAQISLGREAEAGARLRDRLRGLTFTLKAAGNHQRFWTRGRNTVRAVLCKDYSEGIYRISKKKLNRRDEADLGESDSTGGYREREREQAVRGPQF